MLAIENIRTGLVQILLNKGKSLLTMLGIIIGISSVIFLMTIGQSVQHFLVSQLESFGTNIINVYPNFRETMASTDPLQLTITDADLLRRSSLVRSAVALSGFKHYPASVSYQQKTITNATLAGSQPGGEQIYDDTVLQGRYFDQRDYDQAARVAVLFESGAQELFGDSPAIGKSFTADSKQLQVIGVLEDRSSLIPDFGTTIMVPFSTVSRIFRDGSDTIDYIAAKVDNKDNIPATQAAMASILNAKYRTTDGEQKVLVQSQDQFLDVFTNVLLGIQVFLALIAAVSLIVGGIGIMNIMLMTVKERTREIGLRKAVGAKDSYVLLQFLIESIILTLLGGIIGIVLGIVGSAFVVFVVDLVKPDWEFSLTISWLGVGLGCAVAIFTGIVFGLYPALKAARLHPIEALRYE